MIDPTAMAYFVDAQPAASFFGRLHQLETLAQCTQDASAGQAHCVGLRGPWGSGKSELLAQFAFELVRRGAEALPIYLDLPVELSQPTFQSATRERAAWEDLIRSAATQALAYLSGFHPEDPLWLQADASHLAGLCYGAGLPAFAPMISGDWQTPGDEAWRRFLSILKSTAAQPIVLLINGAGPCSTEAWLQRLARMVQAACRERICAVFEAPPRMDVLIDPAGCDLTTLHLPPLTHDEAREMMCCLGRQQGWAIDPTCFEMILPRLGPWPGWIRQFAERLRNTPPRQNPKRRAEEAYLDLLTTGGWATAQRAALRQHVPPSLREGLLRLILSALQQNHSLALRDIARVLSTDELRMEHMLHGLSAHGVVEPRGLRWTVPPMRAIGDWARLMLAESRPDALQVARLDLLSRLLTEPSQTSGPEAPAPHLPELLTRFRLQWVPDVLFDFAAYHEAVGALSDEHRRQLVLHATATMRLPEVIGVAPWHAHDFKGRIFFARAYREGRYQRSCEETWIVADLSAANTLTAPEIERALEEATRIQQRLGPGHYRYWIVMGAALSDEAHQFVKTRGLLCSNPEQLKWLDAMIASSPPRKPPGQSQQTESEPMAAAPGKRRSPIDMFPEQPDPSIETSSLKLPARPDSELIAALMAEKVSLRSDFDSTQAGQVKTAVLEGVLNAIESSPNPEKMIAIDFHIRSQILEIVIENEGEPFEPVSVQAPDPYEKMSARNKRGWGISLMKRFMDEVLYEACPRGTRLRLVKRRTTPQRGQTDDPQAVRGKA